MAVADQAQSDKSDLKNRLRWFAQSSALNAYGMLARAGAAVNSRWDQRDDVSWLLMATMPNSGSTAIAKATFRVYDSMAVQNFNDRQSSRIMAKQADAIREVKEDYCAAIEALGYSL